jgi:hypothetical protein
LVLPQNLEVHILFKKKKLTKNRVFEKDMVELVQSGLIINRLRMLEMVKKLYFGLIYMLKVEYLLRKAKCDMS